MASGSLSWAQKKSGLQGLAGEVLTIYRESGSRGGYWRGVNVAGRGFGTSRLGVTRVSPGHGVSRPLAKPTGASRHGQTSSSCPREATRLIGLEHRDFSVDS